MKKIDINTKEINELFQHIGLNTPDGEAYRKRVKKHRQIFDYLDHLEKAVNRLTTKRTLQLVDCACGKSYLSFIANYYLTRVLKKDVEFTCIDYNEHVIKESKDAAEALGFTNMNFICDDIFNVKFKSKTDIVYSLHACDTATDMTIAKGIIENATYIFTVSCCPHSIRSNMKKHPLTSISKHGIYKERIADMLGDSMRALILDSKGYKTSIFDYVPTSETPKNVMLRANKISVSAMKLKEAELEYNYLRNLFNCEPMVNEYMQVENNKAIIKVC